MHKKLLLSIVILVSYNTTTMTMDYIKMCYDYAQKIATGTLSLTHPTLPLTIAFLAGKQVEHGSFSKEDIWPMAKILAAASAISFVTKSVTGNIGFRLHTEGNKEKARSYKEKIVIQEEGAELLKRGLTNDDSSAISQIGLSLLNYRNSIALGTSIGLLYLYSKYNK